ncbi:cupin domain-containing protein [Aeromicrobium fastidiosum]|uniref:cupin domain-containing protein n=1 Tax=Aeromicrobium fastidiosum TaxID=52699 RepID=UPI0020235874|nr:cupin domain-containing protein [Aeromicrobium fastidiosum]MCL8250130.1 cupin domain-containing protein [Aeromicrobium fastidiosum]
MTTDRVLTDDALATTLTVDGLHPADVLAGTPVASSTELVAARGVEVGVWELTAGTLTDTEVDEVFIVLTGRGEVTFADGEVVPVAPGAVVRLRAGERTTWTITETLRKIYVLLPDTEDPPA